MLDMIEKENTCLGSWPGQKKESILEYRPDNTIFATGGIGGLYQHSTNYPH